MYCRVISWLLCLILVQPWNTIFAQDKDSTQIVSNRLINSHDPYLLLHAQNPVDWYPWGKEALEKAKHENKPIFVSIGYSTCYWCHVAEREIYSNPEIAKLMNHWFINIKVDREQRPDLDRIYMLASQIMIGHGGWPNNVFLTPDLKPFFVGSYFPPQDDNGTLGFPQILTQLHQAWVDDNNRVLLAADQVYRALQQTEQKVSPSTHKLPEKDKLIEQAVQASIDNFDKKNGGFDRARSKFPKSPQLAMLLAASESNQNAIKILAPTLNTMAEGGIMDQLAGGFHRYSTEPTWSIPHFEKMLYDNAQLLTLYAQAYSITKNPFFKQIALRTAHYLTTEMQSPSGLFYSAQDAQVNGVEGASYVWTEKQIKAVLGDTDAHRFLSLYNLTAIPEAPMAQQLLSKRGVLRLTKNKVQTLVAKDQLAAAINKLSPLRDKLLKVRQMRPQPARDEKIITADNALAIIGFVQAGQALNQVSLIKTATQTANWLWKHAFNQQTGELKHQFFQGQSGEQGFLDDYALLGHAFMTLYSVTGNKKWPIYAQKIVDAMLKNFSRANGTLAMSWNTKGLLITPPVEDDSVKPSGQSAAIALLLEVATTSHNKDYATAANKALASIYSQLNIHPEDWGALLSYLNEPNIFTALTMAENSNDNAALDSADHVHAKAQWRQSKERAILMLSVSIDPNYHINANPASSSYLIPTQLLLNNQIVINAIYPKAQIFAAHFLDQSIRVYQDNIIIKAKIPDMITAELPKVSLRIQACNAQACLAPAIIAINPTVAPYNTRIMP